MIDPKDDITNPRAASPTVRRHRERRRRWPFVLGGVVVAIGVLVAVWDWDWFRPLIEREASAQLGRAVTLQHFGLRLGRQIVAVADGVRIANPEAFAQNPPLAVAERLTVAIEAMELLRHRLWSFRTFSSSSLRLQLPKPRTGAPTICFLASRQEGIAQAPSWATCASLAARCTWSWRGCAPISTS